MHIKNIKNKTFIIDGTYHIYKYYFGIPTLKNNVGIQTNIIHGFINMISIIYKKYNPNKIIIVFDSKKKTLEKKYIKNIKKIDHLCQKKLYLK
ncbi:MAG: hypothetical protein BucCj_2650 [Buchnera aphidicola (Ceratovacuna japonica)]